MLRLLVAAVVIAAGTAAVARAAGLAVATTQLGAGAAPVHACLTSIPTQGGTLTVGIADSNSGNDAQSISSVPVSGFPGACAGATLSVSLTNSANAQNPSPTTGQGSCIISGGTATCTISPTVPLTTGHGQSQISDLPLTLALAISGGAGSLGTGSLRVNAGGLAAGVCPAITAVTPAGSTPGDC